MGVCSSQQQVIKTLPNSNPAIEGDNQHHRHGKDQAGHNNVNGKRRVSKRISLQSSDSGLHMRPAEVVDNIHPHELFKLTREDIVTLFSSFETIKKKRELLANDILAALKHKVPGSMEKLDGVIRKGDSWENISQGIILLSGVERCLLRLNDRKRLDDFINKLVNNHIKHFGVPKSMLLAGLDVAATVILKQIGEDHQKPLEKPNVDEEPVKHIWQNCQICSTWATFFELLHKTLDAVQPNNLETTSSTAPGAAAAAAAATPVNNNNNTSPDKQ